MAVILAIDDAAEVRELLKDFLGSKGHSVETAEDGESGLAELAQRSYELVLLDLMMPGMSGLEVLARIRESVDAPPVIVITALHDETTGREALDRGARDYVTKPIDLGYLEQTVTAALLG